MTHIYIYNIMSSLFYKSVRYYIKIKPKHTKSENITNIYKNK